MKPTFIITLKDQLVPDNESSANRLRILLKKVLRSYGFSCVDIKEVVDNESIQRAQPNSRNDGLREDKPTQV